MKKEKPILIALWVMAILVNIKSIFADYDIDNSYALAMTARHLSGDSMFAKMLEPHQTSVFLADLFAFPYLKITGGYTGIILWLHLCGVLAYALLTVCFFRFLKKRVDVRLAHLICIFFFTVRPKQVVFPEFSNMMIAFSLCLFMALTEYLEHQEKTGLLVLSALFTCLETLSYPTCVITYLAVVYLLARSSRRKIRDILIFTVTCVLCG